MNIHFPNPHPLSQSPPTHSKPPAPEPYTPYSPTNRQHARTTSPIHRTHRININLNPRIRRLVRARKRDQRARRPLPTPRHPNLRTRNVKLRAVERARRVQRDVLDAQEVVAWGRGCRDGDGCCGFVCLALG